MGKTKKQDTIKCKWMIEGFCAKRIMCVNNVWECPDFIAKKR